MNKVRLIDIAKAAGVSTATVSNALNRKNRLNPEKADEIRNLAIKMGYLSGDEDRRHSIRFIIFKKHGKVVMDTAFFTQLIDGVQEQCRRRSYDLLINRVNAGDRVRIGGSSGQWLRLSGDSAYMYRTLVRFLSSAETTGDVNVRSGPSTRYGILRTLSSGEAVTLLATDGNFCRVDTGTEIAYVSRKYLRY